MRIVNLTSAQLTTLASDINAPANAAALGAFITNKDATQIASFYNVQASPAWTVWKTSADITAIGDNIVATELAGLTSINATRLQTIALYSPNGVNPSLPDRRAFFDDVFSGAGGAATRAKLLILWKRQRRAHRSNR